VERRDKRWVVAGGLVVLVAGVLAGLVALTARSLGTLVWNPLFDACGVAAVLGLGVIVSALAIDGLIDAQPTYMLELEDHGDSGAPGRPVAGATAPTIVVRRLFANQQRPDTYRTRYELVVDAHRELMCLQVEAHAWSVVRVALVCDGCAEEHGGGAGSGSAWSRLASPPRRVNLDVFTEEPELDIELLASMS